MLITPGDNKTPDIKTKIDAWQAVIDALPDPVFILTESGLYADIVGGRDPSFYHNGSLLIGKHLSDVLAEEKVNWFLKQIRHAIELNGLHTVEYGLSGEDVKGLDTSSGPNGTLWFEGRIQPLNYEYNGEKAVVWVARNITARHALELKLKQESETCALTGAYNKRKLMAELNSTFSAFKRRDLTASLILLDIDYFKQVNDIYGHLEGDKVLKQVANVCQQALRAEDSLFRFGGEEFAILLPYTDLAQAELLADRLRELVASSVYLDQYDRLTISAGIASFSHQDTQEDEILGRADKALYFAKNSGRNNVQTYLAESG